MKIKWDLEQIQPCVTSCDNQQVFSSRVCFMITSKDAFDGGRQGGQLQHSILETINRP